MSKWNYKVLSFNVTRLELTDAKPAEIPEVMWTLNELGNDGWELIDTPTFKSLRPPGDNLVLILKKKVS